MGLLDWLRGAPVPEIEPSELARRLEQGPAPLLIDVRQPVEYRAAHIRGARLVPLATVGRHAGALPRDREVVCICQTGHRSQPAGRRLRAAGLKVVSLRGGMNAWLRQRRPVDGGRAQGEGEGHG